MIARDRNEAQISKELFRKEMWGLPQGRIVFRCNLSSVQGGVGYYMVTVECDEHTRWM